MLQHITAMWQGLAGSSLATNYAGTDVVELTPANFQKEVRPASFLPSN
jgi:hypothetical protein